MKYLFFALFTILFLSNCSQENKIPFISEEYNDQPATTLYLSDNCDTIYLSDYYPLMESVDSVTSADLTINKIDDHNKRFVILSEKASALNTIHLWKNSKKVSLFVIKDADQKWDIIRPWAITTAFDRDSIAILFSNKPQKIVCMWQNTVLPREYYALSDTKMSVRIPSEAKTMARSSIRLIALTEDGITTNDLLVTLEYGKAINDPNDLTRKDKQALVLYSLMIDRFNNGNKENDQPLNQPDVLPTVDYQGGDICGITQKIKEGFFNNMGVNTIWISPIAKNAEGTWGMDKDPFTRFSGYHGYWPVNPTVVDSHFGSDAEVREMLDEAHKNGLNIILDYVANHLHQESRILKENPDWCTPMYLPDGRPNIRLFDEHRLTTWFDSFLPTLDLARNDVCEAMTDSAVYWVKNYEFDGFRHDAAKHIPENYWRMLTGKIKRQAKNKDIFQIGETYGSPKLLRSYVKSGMLDSQFNFGIYHSAVYTFGTYEKSMKDLLVDLTQSLNSYGYHNLMSNISGNHDKPRFISVAGGTVSLKEDTKAAGRKRKIEVGDILAYRKFALLEAFMFTIPGIPCVYQGDEYGVPGANDPDNRRMMQFDGYNEHESKLLETVKNIIKIRNANMPLIYGDLLPLYTEEDVMVFVRVYMGKTAIVALNRSNEAKEIRMNPSFSFGFDKIKSNFGQTFNYNNGVLSLSLEPLAFEILTEK